MKKLNFCWVGILLLLSCEAGYALPQASFTADQTSGCSPLSVQFTSTSTGATRYFWDLGNGNTSTLPNPANLYVVTGTYTITLIAFDASNNADTARYVNYITVVAKPTADFTADITSSCPDNNLITFTNLSNGANTYLWDFGDGNTSALQNPTHTYTQSGRFTITLIATNSLGCQDVQILNQYITIFPKPTALIVTSTTASCDPSTVFNFTNSSAGNNSWNWNFGDGTTSSAQNPSHTYSAPGNYNVSLIINNSFGCSDTSDLPTHIIIGSSQWADFSVADTVGCAPMAITFNNLNADVTSCIWDFGDGSTSLLLAPNHTYVNPGLYTVTLIVTTSNGCTDTVRKVNYINLGLRPNVSFTYSGSIGCSPLDVQFTNTSTNFVSCQWWFGDGTTSTAINPTHTYITGGVFSVTLKCWGPTGCVRNITLRDIITVTKSTAIFSASPRIGCPPLTSNFIALSPGSGLTYNWLFGDGTTSTLQNPTHNYNTAGNFDVTLVVRDSLGCTDTIKKINYIQTVNPAANYIPPPTTSGCAPLTTQFTDGSAGAIGWLWNFGDGVTSTLQNPTHSYTTPGFYTVSLTTTSAGGGCTQTINNFSSFQVNGGSAGFTHTVTACPPYIATFQDTSLNAVSWFWDFGDGLTSTQQSPVHPFTSPGAHSVSLTITTADGCSYTTMQSNSVVFQPFGANFFGIPLDTIYPRPVQFFSNSVGATSWLWDFGDSTTSTLQDPLHIFQHPGDFNVTLTISNGTCTLFYDPPPFQFGLPDTTPVDVGNRGEPVVQQGCVPLNVLFTNAIPGSSIWLWDFGDGSISTQQFPTHNYTVPGIYNVSLTATDTLGIVQVLTMDSIVRVFGPVPGFILNQVASCANTQVNLVDTSQNAMIWHYEFGDSTSSSIQSPSHSYTTGRPNYIITQTVSDTLGCTASISTSIFANFVSPLLASESEVCGFDTVHFFTSLQNYSAYSWDFGDGTTSNIPTPSHLYTTEGVFPVTLTVTDLGGCSQTFSVNPPIKVNLPIANFTTGGVRHGCNQLSVGFINNSQNADFYQWDLGDGTITSVETPIWRYTIAGVYDVTLTVFRGSCISTMHMPQYIRVDTAHAEFSMNIDQICFPSTATFTDLSAVPVTWQWTFGNGDSATTENPIYTYTSRPAAFPILVMTDIHGCVDTASVANFPFLIANYTTDVDSGCFPLTVQFTNHSSLITSSLLWNFGDGTTSTQTNPTHTYAQPGNYDVTLVATSQWANCADTLFLPARIKVKQPHADFTSTDLNACAPSIVSFTDLSVDGDNYLWDFGDSTTSTNSTPSHIYNTPGIYTVNLIVTSDLGCSDTIVKPQFIHVLGPITNFTASAFVGCDPLTVTFTDLCTNAVSWSWSFGDGYAATSLGAVHTFRDTGNFTVSLVATDTAGCNSFFQLPQAVVIHPSPVAAFTTPILQGCDPFIGNFINMSSGQTANFWDFGDGGTDTSANPTHTFLNSGNYDVRLVTTNSFGCPDSAHLPQPITVLASPLPNVTVTNRTGCSPFNVTFINSTTNVSGPSYLWDFGNGQTSSLPNPNFTFNNPGFYDINLTVTNSNGCSNSVSYPAQIHVLDTVPPSETNILSVSVMNNTSVKIIWANNPAIDLAAYVLYRKDIYTNQYHAIFTENNPQNTTFSLTSEYVDTGLTTLTNTYTYKIQAVDICGYTIPLDLLKSHTTINISSQPSGEDIFVSWTPYGGCPISTYELYRAEPGGTFSYLATLDSSTLSYLDTTFICPVPYSYKVMATDLCGNTYTSYSDTSVTYPFNTLAAQTVDVVRSTVVDNKTVLTEWKQPTVHPEMIAQFDLYRSTDNTNFSYLTSLPSVQTDYMDYNVDVQNIHYFYKILVINSCRVGEALSGNTSTIIIKGDMNEARQVHLEWTPYIGWENGVDYYILEKMDDQGHWQLLKQVDGNTRAYDYQE